MSSPYVSLVRPARPLWSYAVVILAALLALSGLLATRPPSDSPAIAPSLSRLPLSFVPNAGQASQEASFVVRGVGAASLLFTQGSVALASPGAVARLVFQNASPAVELQGTDPLPGVANYYLGDDPDQWRTGLPTYGAVVYRQLYPGIDLRYEGATGSLKGTYTIAPGAHSARIRWSYQEATGVRVDEATGNLLVTLPATGLRPQPLPGEVGNGDSALVESAPVAWQTVGGRRTPVEVRYVLYEGAAPAVGFALGAYDAAVPLTIDPTLAYSTYLGGGSSDEGNSIAVDAQGNAYITGETYSSDLPGATNSRSTNNDAFVSKLNSAGSAVVYTTYVGGSGRDTGYGVAVDNSGNAYVTGSTDSTDLPLKNATQPAYGGNTDAFITKLTASGSLSYSTYIGDAYYEYGAAIAVNRSTGDAYVTGVANNNVLAVRLDPSGASVYAGSFGGFSEDKGLGIAVDSSGNAYITGETSSFDFPITHSLQFCDKAPNNTTAGCHDAFVSVLNPTGTDFLFSTFLGGGSADDAHGIALDSQSNIYIVGSTISQDFPTVNPYQASCAGAPDGCSDAFVAKIKSDLSGLAYSTYLGGATGVALGNGIAVDMAQDAYVVGTTSSPNFPVTTNATQPAFGGGICGSYPTRYCYDAFVAEFSPAGNALTFSTYVGGVGEDQGRGIASDSSGAVYVTGLTESATFPTVNPLHSYQPPRDAFVTKISSGNAATPTATPVAGATPTSTPATPTVQPPTSTATPVNTPVGGLAKHTYLPLTTRNNSSGW